MRTAILALVLAPVAALAAQTLSGDYLELNYSDYGTWYSPDDGAGLMIRDDPTSSFVDATQPGNPWTQLRFAYEIGGTATTAYAETTSSGAATDMTLDLEADVSWSTYLISQYTWSTSDLSIEKTELLDEAGKAVLVGFEVTNLSTTDDIDDLVVMLAFDPDQDAGAGYYNTLNDVYDDDADGYDEWVESVGPDSEWTLGFGLCDLSDELGHTSWQTSTDATLYDLDAASGDYQMHWRHTEASIAAGDTAWFVVILAFDETAVDAWIAYDDMATDWCGVYDDDGDGYAWEDCDDTDATVSQGEDEYCDGVDNNCDGEIDEDTALDADPWYPDADGDGYGEDVRPTVACDPPTGYVDNDEDCNDAEAAAYPGAAEVCDGVDNDCDGITDPDDSVDAPTWYFDADGDGYGDPDTGVTTCTGPEGWIDVGGDCDDGDPEVNPGMEETCDGVDEDCDGVVDDDPVDGDTWWLDGDGDGYGVPGETTRACDLPTGYADNKSDCDDGDAGIHPGAAEHCNGYDEDCDDEIDEDATDTTAWYLDEDGDGWGDPATAVYACDPPDGTIDNGGDCDDGDPDAYPWAPGLDDLCEPIDPDDDVTAGCKCSSSASPVGSLAALALLPLLWLRRRRP